MHGMESVKILDIMLPLKLKRYEVLFNTNRKFQFRDHKIPTLSE